MDIIKINENSLKLILTAEDMSDFSLDIDSIAYNSLKSVSSIRDLLYRAARSCGFPTDFGKVSVQLYVSVKGGCEIFVKKLDTIVASALDTRLDTDTHTQLPEKISRGIYVYSFNELSAMIQACKRLQTAKYMGDSAAYCDKEKKIYYLIIDEKSPLPEEHGGHFCKKNTAYYINEHCRLICRSAVGFLGNLA